MATNRTTIVRGPGAATLGTTVLHDASGITAEIESSTAEIPSSVSGTLDTIKTDQLGKVSLTPAGEVSAEILAALFPHQTPSIGSSIFGATDVALVVHSVAGQKVTFHAAALTKSPDLILSPVATAFGGSAEFTAILAKGKAPADVGGLYTVEAAAYAAGGPSNTSITGSQYTGTWGDLSILDTAAGWTVSVEMSVQPVVVDTLGTIDFTLTGVTVRARCQPVGLAESAILGALPAKTARGLSVSTANDLVVAATSPGLTVTLKNASMMTGPLAWGTTQLRVGEVGFLAHREFAAGVPGELYKVEATAAA